MRKTFLTLLLAGVVSMSASAQQKAKTFPKCAKSEPTKAMLAAPANIPSSIDDKALGTKIYATQTADESKLRSWLYFYDKNPYQLNRIKIYENEVGTQYSGLHLGAWGGDTYYGFYGNYYPNAQAPAYEWRSFEGFVSVDVATGELTTIRDMRVEGTNGLVGDAIYYNVTGEQNIPIFLDLAYNPADDMLYATAKYQKDEYTNAVSRLYTIDKTTGQWSQVTTIEDPVMEFCFDYDGNMYTISPYWKPSTNEDGSTVYTWSGTYLTVYDENYNQIDGKRMRIKNLEKSDIFANSYGSLQFNHSTGELYLTSLIASSNSGENNYERLVKIDPNTGKYVESNTFMGGNQIIGLYIPYFEADDRGAAARVADLNATPNAENGADVEVAWTNPTKAWNGDDLTELAEVQVYRKKAGVTACAMSSKDIYDNSDLVATVPATSADLGKAMTWKDNTPNDGINTYYVVPCRVSGEKGVPDSIRCTAGLDIPGVATEFTAAADGQNVKLTWKAPVDGKNNGFINAASLTYDIVRNPGNVAVATDVAGTEFTDQSVASVERAKVTYTIVAKNAKGAGDPVQSNEIEAGMAPLPPVTFVTNTEDDANQWTAFEDAMGDWQKWEWTAWNQSYRLITGQSSAQDWTASPAFRLEKGKTYLFTSSFRNDYPNVGHTIARYVGTAPTLEGMTTKIGEEKEYSASSSYENNPVISYEDEFTAPEDGTYYFGFCVTDNTDYDVLYFYGVSIEGIYNNDIKASEIQIYGNDVVSGDDNMCKVIVKNNGREDVAANAYKVEILQKVDGNEVVVGSVETTPILRAGSTAEVDAKFNPRNDGEQQFAYRVVYDKDEFLGNNTSEYQTINVIAYGDATPWSLIVTDGDEWNYTQIPFAFADPDDGSQSVYTKADLAENPTGNNTIERIGYEYTGNVSDALTIANLSVWMKNVDFNSFTDATGWVDESEMTQVFNGDVTVYPGKNVLSLQLNDAFQYNPTKNLLVCVEHAGTVSQMFPCSFRTFNENGMRNRSLRYWSPKTNKFLVKGAPVLYVGFTPNRSNGISEVNGTAAGNVYYNAATGKLVLGGAQAQVYDLSGKLLRSYNNAAEVMPNLPSGMYIVKSTSNGNVQSVKLNINK